MYILWPMNSTNSPTVDHLKVELIRVLECCLLLQFPDNFLLAVVSFRPDDIVLVLLKKPKLLPRLRLCTLLMSPPRNRVPQRRHLPPPPVASDGAREIGGGADLGCTATAGEEGGTE